MRVAEKDIVGSSSGFNNNGGYVKHQQLILN